MKMGETVGQNQELWCRPRPGGNYTQAEMRNDEVRPGVTHTVELIGSYLGTYLLLGSCSDGERTHWSSKRDVGAQEAQSRTRFIFKTKRLKFLKRFILHRYRVAGEYVSPWKPRLQDELMKGPGTRLVIVAFEAGEAFLARPGCDGDGVRRHGAVDVTRKVGRDRRGIVGRTRRLLQLAGSRLDSRLSAQHRREARKW